MQNVHQLTMLPWHKGDDHHHYNPHHDHSQVEAHANGVRGHQDLAWVLRIVEFLRLRQLSSGRQTWAAR